MDKIDKKKKLKKKLKQKQKQKQTVKTSVKVNVQSSGGSGGGGFAPAGPASIPATFRDTAGENIRLASLVEQAVGRAARQFAPTYDTESNSNTGPIEVAKGRKVRSDAGTKRGPKNKSLRGSEEFLDSLKSEDVAFAE